MTRATKAHVHLWNHRVGQVGWDPERGLAHFAYDAELLERGLPVAPITMPLDRGQFAFPDLNTEVFKGLPGFLADSLPDKFGTMVIDTWLKQQDLDTDSVDPVTKLRLIGDRGMGALEYTPLLRASAQDCSRLPLAKLVDAINRILNPTAAALEADVLELLMDIGIAADGSRAKAVVAFDPSTEEVLAEGTALPAGFEHWLLKFDGITGNRDREASDPQGWGKVEFAYYLMARAADITMSECRLLEEHDRHHFLTRRFDRTQDGGKLHRQSLCAMGHMDFDALGAYSYEEVADIMHKLNLPQSAVEEHYRRMLFNVLARNHDDHPKNIAFLMTPDGTWSLAPAYDLTFAYNPEGHWTNRHQMTLNRKRDHFTKADFAAVADHLAIPLSRAQDIQQQVQEAVSQWSLAAERAGVSTDMTDAIRRDLRLNIC